MAPETPPVPPVPFWLSLFIVLTPIVAGVLAAQWVHKRLQPEVGDDGAFVVSMVVAAVTGMVTAWAVTRALPPRGAAGAVAE